MKRVMLVLMCVCAATSYGVTVHDNPTGGTMWAWNWGDNTVHTATEVDLGGGNYVVHHEGVVDNSVGVDPVNARFGSKWDFTVSGNTSANPADYTVSFDVRNIAGNWDPIPLGVAVLTKEVGGDYGHGYALVTPSIADGWVHVEINMADYVNDWWQGTAWDLTNPNWSMEIGMPWPGESVAAGESFTQVWETDNLQISMVPEPATLALLGLGALTAIRKRK
jgi:hypothetical protein